LLQRLRPVFQTPLVVEACKFAVVGLLNTGADLMTLNCLILVTGSGRAGGLYSLFKTISFLVAVLNSYFLNSRWTFQWDRNKKAAATASRFLLISVVGLIVNVTSASYVVTAIRPIHGFESYWPSLAAVIGTFCGLFLNFTGYRHLACHSAVHGNRVYPGSASRIEVEG
jgi:putative flippase GtrA